MGKDSLQTLRVLGRISATAALLSADNHRYLDSAARHVAHLGRLVKYLIGRHPGEIHKHQLRHGVLAGHSQAHSSADKACLRDRRLEHPLRAEARQQPLGHLKHTAVNTDVLAQ